MEKNAYQIYGLPVRAYWHEAEGYMVSCMAKVLHDAASIEDAELRNQFITAYCNTMQEQAFEDAGALLNAVRWYMSHNSNTMKNGRNPETHEVLDELKEIEPLQVTLNPSGYQSIPEIPEETESGGQAAGNAIYWIAAVIVVILAAGVVLYHYKKKRAA